MRTLLLFTTVLLFLSCKSTVERRPVEYYNILKVKEFTNNDINYLPEVYAEGDIIFDKHNKIATFTFKLREYKKDLIYQEFKSRQQGMRIDEIFIIQKYDTQREGKKITLNEIETFFLIKGKRTKVVQDHFNNRYSSLKNKENSGVINLIKNAISPEVEYLPYVIIANDNVLELEIDENIGTIKSETTSITVDILPEYKYINK